MVYNLTDIARVNSSVEFVQNVNSQLSMGWFGPIILISIFTIVFMAFMWRTGLPVKSATGAAFIAFTTSLFFLAIGIVPVMATWITLIILALGVAFWNLD